MASVIELTQAWKGGYLFSGSTSLIYDVEKRTWHTAKDGHLMSHGNSAPCADITAVSKTSFFEVYSRELLSLTSTYLMTETGGIN